LLLSVQDRLIGISFLTFTYPRASPLMQPGIEVYTSYP
jgi:hypothetical protein